MNTLSTKDKYDFQEYVAAARESKGDLSFFLDNQRVQLSLDYSASSLDSLENLYWNFRNKKIPFNETLGTLADFINLVCRYLGECIIAHTSASWIQANESNHRNGQPCLDGFGNEKWDRIYPVELANNFGDLPNTNPMFPGVRNRQVLSTQLKKAIKIQDNS